MTDREIDALVAEKVMGWRWVQTMGRGKRSEHPDEHVWLLPPLEAAKFLPTALRECAPVKPRNPHRRDLPFYSTDMAASFALVERMREIVAYQKKTQTYSFQLCQTGIPGDWMCSFVVNEFDWSHQAMIDGEPTAPLAICKAALKGATHD